MLRKCSLFLIVALCVLAGWYHNTRAQKVGVWQFAYRVSDEEQTRLILVDPASPLNPSPRSVEGPAAYPHLTSNVLGSPNGEWIAALWSSGDSYAYSHWMLRLYNVSLGQALDVAEGFSFWSLVAWWTPQLLAWSPDSTYLAFQSKEPPPFDDLQRPTPTTLYLYNVAQTRLTPLLVTPGSNLQFSWSADSTHLVSTAQRCPADHTDPECTVEFSVYDMRAPESPARTLDLTAHGIPIWRQERAICNLKLSPEARYVSFVLQCSYGGVTPQEVYIWDTKADTVNRVTDFTTTSAQRRPDSIIAAYYDTYWQMEGSLLVSFIYSEAIGPTKRRYGRTIRVDASSSQLTTLAEEATAYWAANPVSGALASVILAIQPEDSHSLTRATNTQVLPTTDNSTTLTAQSLAQAKALPAGCFPRWSPDGQWLAYEQPYGAECQPIGLHGLVFYRPTADELVTYPIPESARSGNTYIQAVGWVRVE